MDDLEKEYQENFSDQEMSNDDFDVDGLWADIHADLDAQAPTKPSYFTKGNVTILLLVAFVGGLGWYSHFENTEIERSSEQVSITSPDEVDTYDLNAEPTTITNTSSILVEQQKTATVIDVLTENEAAAQQNLWINERVEQEVAARNNKQDGANLIKKAPQEIQRNKDASFSSIVSTRSADEKSSNDLGRFNEQRNNLLIDGNLDIVIIGHANTSHSLETTNDDVASNTLNKGRIDEEKGLPLATITTTLDKLPLLPFTPIESTTAIEEAIMAKKTLGLTATQKKSHWAVAAYSGVNQLHAKYLPKSNLDVATLRNNNLNAEWGTTYGVNFSQERKHWHFRTGIARHDLWNRLDFQTSDTTIVFKEQEVLRVLINGGTGEVLSTEFGDTTVLALTTLNTIHFNRFRMYSIPLEIGWHQRRGAWQYAITAGVVFNFSQQAAGRDFAGTGSLTDYSATDTPVLLRPFSTGWSLSPSLAYQLSSRVQLQLQPRWTWSKHRLENSTVKVQQYNLDLGLQYRF